MASKSFNLVSNSCNNSVIAGMT
ncbi:hypothetical protein CY0110_18527 [Crocosphaera chwakensis CCY0110]|uniref:Uncharacterized protein n=1 Tax=Crocosphaera chwakensis CCY0110 TaxID=391612 RepID=A3IJ37_9CHRO|nr:hypothetical protein CY0110_18527 [Crocosphaera chwakensis CCY0110]